MEKFDWIQWYLVGSQLILFGCCLMLDGKPRKDNHSMKDWIFATAISLPYVGRVYGWW